MINLPENIKSLNNYKPGKPVEEIIAEYNLKKTAILWNNENTLGSSPKAIEAMKIALSASNLYPDAACIELRTKIAAQTGRKKENIIAGNGSEAILSNVFQAFFSQGDELLTSEGTFVAIYIWAQAHNVPFVKVPLTTDYRFDLTGILEKINSKTKVIYLSNPNNPTGSIITESELKEFMIKVPRHILVVVDEAYFEFAGALSKSYPDSTQLGYPNVLTLRTFSKAYGIAGVRIGYAIGEETVIEALMKVKLTFEPSNIALAAGCGAIEDTDFLDKTVDNNTSGLNYFYKEFEKLNLNFFPSYGNFIMLDLITSESVQAIYQNLLMRGVFIRPLTAFGLPHCVRITVGTPEENQLCVEKLGEIKNLFLNTLPGVSSNGHN